MGFASTPSDGLNLSDLLSIASQRERALSDYITFFINTLTPIDYL